MKKYGVVQIKNPSTDGHTVKLLPLQSFQIICTKHNCDDKFDIAVNGDFLIATTVSETNGVVVFKIEQKYDVSDWVEISDLFAGNVTLFKKCRNADSKIRLCVYCSGEKPKDSVLTVVNPDDFLVKIEPHQVLHIVNYDEEDDFKFSVLNKDLLLKCIRCETVVNDFTSVYDKDSIFCPEPRSNTLKRNLSFHQEFLQNEILGARVITETHFWFCMSRDDAEEYYGGRDQVRQGGDIAIRKENDNFQTIGKIELLIGVRSKRKMGTDYFDAVHNMARDWKDRSLSYSKKSILNPYVVENLNISESESWFYVEMPHPSIYFSDLKEGSWLPQQFEVECFELKSRFINGHRVQRFLITGITCFEDCLNLGYVCFSAGFGRNVTLNFWKISSNSLSIVKSERTIVKSANTVTDSEVVTKIELELVEGGELHEEEFVLLGEVSTFDYSSYYEYGGDYGFGGKTRF